MTFYYQIIHARYQTIYTMDNHQDARICIITYILFHYLSHFIFYYLQGAKRLTYHTVHAEYFGFISD